MAGFNLTATARRGTERIIVTVFGGRSGKTRDEHVAELMDLGFEKAGANTSLRRPQMPKIPFGKVSRVDTTVASASKRLLRPPVLIQPADAVADEILGSVVASQGDADPEASLGQVIENHPPLEFARPLRRPAGSQEGQESGNPVNGIMLGRFATSLEADKKLMQVAVIDYRSLGLARKDIEKVRGGYVAKFTNLSPDVARKACARLAARNVECLLTRSE